MCYCLKTVVISLFFNKTKKINCFIHIALAKYCWVMKLGEFKSEQKDIPN